MEEMMEINIDLNKKIAIINDSYGICVVEADYDLIKNNITRNNNNEIKIYDINTVHFNNQQLSIICSKFDISVIDNVLVINRTE